MEEFWYTLDVGKRRDFSFQSFNVSIPPYD